MISKSFKLFFLVLIIISVSFSLKGEEKIDIWKNKNKSSNTEKKLEDLQDTKKILPQTQSMSVSEKIEIEEGLKVSTQDQEVFGIYDPADFNFNLNMWSSTKAEDVRASIKRIKKINLSRTSSEILENVLLSFSYPPSGMTNQEFVNLKLNWMIENNKSELIESFLEQNQEFDGKSKAVQFLVDQSISQADIKEGCNTVEFIDSKIKDCI